MSDIPNFTKEQISKVLGMIALDKLQLKDINHVLLAYFTIPSLLSKDQIYRILDRCDLLIWSDLKNIKKPDAKNSMA